MQIVPIIFSGIVAYRIFIYYVFKYNYLFDILDVYQFIYNSIDRKS